MTLGRGFTADEDQPNGPHVAVLSYGLWQRHFAADPSVTGKTILLSGTPYVVVGVTGPAFNTELDKPPEIWLPFQIDPASTDHARFFNVVARLKSGVSLAAARAQLELASNEFRRAFPDMLGAQQTFNVQPMPEALVTQVRPLLFTLAGAVSLVLLIACANVANLTLARGTGRRREIALRAALGAGRGRIIRQLLTESVALSLAGGALGLALGLAGVRALLAINPGDLPRIGENGAAVSMDWRVALFGLLVSALTGVLFGILPAMEASRADLNMVLKEGAGRGTGFRGNRTRSWLVISEIALALVLLTGAALLIRSFIELRTVHPGFDSDNILTARMSLGGSHFTNTAAVSQLIDSGTQRVESLPGVLTAAASYTLPLEGAFGVPFNIVGRAPPANDRYDGRGWHAISPHYFDVFRIPIVRGRAFSQRDNGSGARVAIVNESFARKFWPAGDAIGRRVLLGKGYGPEFEEPEREIVGIAGDVRDNGLNSFPHPTVYVPMSQVTDGITALVTRASRITWMVRTRVGPRSLSAPISKELEQASAGLPVSHVRTMSEIMAESTAGANFNMVLLSVFSTAALLLAVIGIYGLMAYSVGQRTQEIGIRMALGADARNVRRMITREGMRLSLIGVAIGVAAAFGLTRVLAQFLFGVKPWDPLVFIVVPILLSLAGLAAVWFPARRAAAIDPVTALRAGG